MFVAKRDAPIIGHFIDLPPRKKLELFFPAFFLKAINIPKPRLPVMMTESTSQSRGDRIRFI